MRWSCGWEGGHRRSRVDDITDPVAAARAGKAIDPSSFEGLTNWELYKISQSPQAWDRITWYKGGKIGENPFR